MSRLLRTRCLPSTLLELETDGGVVSRTQVLKGAFGMQLTHTVDSSGRVCIGSVTATYIILTSFTSASLMLAYFCVFSIYRTCTRENEKKRSSSELASLAWLERWCNNNLCIAYVGGWRESLDRAAGYIFFALTQKKGKIKHLNTTRYPRKVRTGK